MLDNLVQSVAVNELQFRHNKTASIAASRDSEKDMPMNFLWTTWSTLLTSIFLSCHQERTTEMPITAQGVYVCVCVCVSSCSLPLSDISGNMLQSPIYPVGQFARRGKAHSISVIAGCPNPWRPQVSLLATICHSSGEQFLVVSSP